MVPARSLPAPCPILVVGRALFFMLPAQAGSTFSNLNGPGPPTWANLGQLAANLIQLGAKAGQLGPTWGQSGRTWGQLRLIWDQLGTNLVPTLAWHPASKPGVDAFSRFSIELELISVVANPKGGNRALSIRIRGRCIFHVFD